MLGPVYNAHTPPSVASAIFAQIIGVVFVYVAVFGRLRGGLPSSFSRITNVLIFSGVGIALVSGSFVELHRAGAGDVTGAIAVFAIAAPLIGIEFFRWLRFHGSDSWPTTEGTIEVANVREVHTRSSHYFKVEMGYSYLVNGEYYSGRFTKDFDREAEAWDYAKAMKGRIAPIRYNPAKIECSRIIDQNVDGFSQNRPAMS
jgi:hypothetical protein